MLANSKTCNIGLKISQRLEGKQGELQTLALPCPQSNNLTQIKYSQKLSGSDTTFPICLTGSDS